MPETGKLKPETFVAIINENISVDVARERAIEQATEADKIRTDRVIVRGSYVTNLDKPYVSGDD